MRLAARLLAAALAMAPLVSPACGVCVEDKVAATYDHAVIARAAEQGRIVVFAEPHAAIDAGRVAKALAGIASRTSGIDPSSIRTATSPASFSFSLDPRAASPLKALDRIQRAANIPGLQLSLLKVVEPGRDR